jgi:predicted TIM-barrel fold metal-dependent hydrolase
MNEFAADVKRQYPDRFGFFASLSLDKDNMDAASEEIAYALDELDADGFVLLSNSSGIYLGDPRLRPVLAELDKRAALVFVHPTIACCQHMYGHEHHSSPAEEYAHSSPLASVYPAPLFEFFFDSARSILDLLASGTILRFPRVRWIVSHCGNVLPSLLDRL